MEQSGRRVGEFPRSRGRKRGFNVPTSIHRLCTSPALFLVAASLATGHAGEIDWKSGAVLPPPQAAPEVSAALTRIAERGESQHVVVQFADAVTPAQRVVLEECWRGAAQLRGQQRVLRQSQSKFGRRCGESSRGVGLGRRRSARMEAAPHADPGRRAGVVGSRRRAQRQPHGRGVPAVPSRRTTGCDGSATRGKSWRVVVDVLETVNGFVIELPLDKRCGARCGGRGAVDRAAAAAVQSGQQQYPHTGRG